MHTPLNRSNYLILALIVFIGIISTANFPYRSQNYIDYSGITDSLESATIADSLPFHLYRSKVDSLIALDLCRRSRLVNQGKGLYSSFAGYTVINETDGCPEGWPPNDQPRDKYFLVLPGYRLNNTVNYYSQNNQYFIKGESWTRDSNKMVNKLLQKEIPIRYVRSVNDPKVKGLVLLPLSGSQFQFVKVITIVVTALIALAFIIIAIILPFRVLMSVARGKAFNRRNITFLRTTGWGLIALALLSNLLSFLFSYVYSPEIPNEIYLPFWDTLLNNSGLIIAGLVVLLIASAFRKGYLVQLDNRLII